MDSPTDKNVSPSGGGFGWQNIRSGSNRLTNILIGILDFIIQMSSRLTDFMKL